MINKWYHTAVSNDSDSNVLLYLNGSNVGIGKNYAIKGIQGVVYIGEGPTGMHEYLKGVIDDIRIYSRTLSEAEILELYNDNPSGQNVLSVTPSNQNVGSTTGTTTFTVSNTGTGTIGLNLVLPPSNWPRVMLAAKTSMTWPVCGAMDCGCDTAQMVPGAKSILRFRSG